MSIQETIDITIPIHCEEHPIVRFAASELTHYLERITGHPVHISGGFSGECAWALWVNRQSGPVPDLPEVSNPDLDDAIAIHMEEGAGFILGNNPRSLLLAVYRFLREVGCSWVRPGQLGERIPHKGVRSLSASLVEKAALRHRGICIEGAVSQENLVSMIDWAPKAGFNTYFIQFREAYTFFERWYAHWFNPNLSPESFGVEQAREIVREAVNEIKKRGMMYHAVGHGWTCELLGIPGLGWVPQLPEVDEQTRELLATVNGQREIWQGIPLNTNLCYSNPRVQQLLVDNIVAYAVDHPEVDYLHFWLADESNNQCECQACRQATPADFYVEILNRIDERMTELGLRTRIVFLIYYDLLWTPVVARLHTPERFTLMFAPLTRTYSRSFDTADDLPLIPPYQRNRLKFPDSVEENLAFLKNWQTIFSGDSFAFDYHFWRAHYHDLGGLKIVDVLYQDIHHLKAMDLNGLVSCQVQRCFFPSGFGMTVMGRALWDERQVLGDLARDYFSQAFGRDGQLVRRYLARLSRLSDLRSFRGEKSLMDGRTARRFASIRRIIADFLPVIERNLDLDDPCWAKSWQYLLLHANMTGRFARVAELLARHELVSARDCWDNLQTWLAGNEEELQPVFDLYEFIAGINQDFFKIDIPG